MIYKYRSCLLVILCWYTYIYIFIYIYIYIPNVNSFHGMNEYIISSKIGESTDKKSFISAYANLILLQCIPLTAPRYYQILPNAIWDFLFLNEGCYITSKGKLTILLFQWAYADIPTANDMSWIKIGVMNIMIMMFRPVSRHIFFDSKLYFSTLNCFYTENFCYKFIWVILVLLTSYFLHFLHHIPVCVNMHGDIITQIYLLLITKSLSDKIMKSPSHLKWCKLFHVRFANKIKTGDFPLMRSLLESNIPACPIMYWWDL